MADHRLPSKRALIASNNPGEYVRHARFYRVTRRAGIRSVQLFTLLLSPAVFAMRPPMPGDELVDKGPTGRQCCHCRFFVTMHQAAVTLDIRRFADSPLEGDPAAERLCVVQMENAEDSFGSWAAVRQTVAMLQHYLKKQTLCRRDCEPLQVESRMGAVA
jgi:hypothetical protein